MPAYLLYLFCFTNQGQIGSNPLCPQHEEMFMFSTKPEVNDASYGSITFGNPDNHPIFTHHLCTQCHLPRITQARFEFLRNLQKTTNPNQRMLCHPCGEMLAKQESKRKQSRVLPINKSTPTYISDPEMLKQLNPKRTT